MSRLRSSVEEDGRRELDTSCNACYEIVYVKVVVGSSYFSEWKVVENNLWF